MDNIKDMGKLITLNKSTDQETLDQIFNNEITVYEDIQGSKIWVNWDGEKFNVKPKSINNDCINLVDLAMQNYYNPAIKFFEGLSDRVRGLMNHKWYFCFEYFPDSQPANIEYDRVPKNHLVLTSINKNGKYDVSVEELDEYSRLFDVDVMPIVFQGKLNEKQIEAIKYFLNTSEKDLEYIFGEKSFSFFFYKILNPLSKNSFLMDDEDFQPNLQKLIIRLKDSEVSFELLNPLYKRISDTNTTDFTEIYTLILLNFLNFCQSFNLEEIKLKGTKRDEIYIYLICKLFNIYISEVKDDLLQFDFVIPEFFDKEKFKINTELITNKLTQNYIKENPKLEYIFKILLSSLNKKKKNPIGVFTDNTVILFNKFIDSINDYIEKYLNRIREVELNRSGLIDFGEFFEIQYDTDADDQVYPDVYTEFEKSPEEKKKKGKGKGKIGIPSKGAGLPPEEETPTT
jgi:hypothetical protein